MQDDHTFGLLLFWVEVLEETEVAQGTSFAGRWVDV